MAASGERLAACHEYGRKDDDGSGGGKKKMNIALLYRPGHLKKEYISNY